MHIFCRKCEVAYEKSKTVSLADHTWCIPCLTRMAEKHLTDTEESEERDPPMSLIDLRFMGAMATCFKGGIKDGRKAFDWMLIKPDTENAQKYRGKILRHLLDAALTEDMPRAMQHMAAIACDANILWNLLKKIDKYNDNE
jgi:hypothetical protein